MMPYPFIVAFHCNIAAIIALPLVAIIAVKIFNITQPYYYYRVWYTGFIGIEGATTVNNVEEKLVNRAV